jgi:hypothetical protein
VISSMGTVHRLRMICRASRKTHMQVLRLCVEPMMIVSVIALAIIISAAMGTWFSLPEFRFYGYE